MKHDLSSMDMHKACKLALRRTAALEGERRLKACAKLLGLFKTDVEGIYGDWQNGYWCDVVASYLNMGDTYTPTILWVRGDDCASERFIVLSLGDWIERNEKRYGIR